MTVAELITVLQGMPQGHLVLYEYDDEAWRITECCVKPVTSLPESGVFFPADETMEKPKNTIEVVILS